MVEIEKIENKKMPNLNKCIGICNDYLALISNHITVGSFILNGEIMAIKRLIILWTQIQFHSKYCIMFSIFHIPSVQRSHRFPVKVPMG